MKIGVPKEIKIHEYRVGLTPAAVVELTSAGHEVLVETRAGTAIGFSDAEYSQAGARICGSAEAVFKQSELIVKVKEPQLRECAQLSKGQGLFTFLHLAPDLSQAHALIYSGATCIAYETVTNSYGGLPLLAPMSEVAGRMSIQAAAHCMEKTQGGRGVLLGGVPGVEPGRVVIIGGGVVGFNAARMALGLGARVTVLDRSLPRLREIDNLSMGQITTVYSSKTTIETHCLAADAIIGAVLIPGASAPKVIDRALIKRMSPGTVLVDVAIDQGGCFETSKPTTHENPTYVVDGVLHYCVANIPGAVARTSTLALNNATLPFVMELANKGLRRALLDDVHLRAGLNLHEGHYTCEAVAKAHRQPWIDPVKLL